MIVDAREVATGSLLRADVCIVGAGVAGITLALEFERHGIDVLLLESGGHAPDAGTRDLNRGENIGIPFAWADGARSRFLGGSSNCWGGWCRPLRTHEMAERDWIPESGWPFDRRTLDPYYERAHRVLNLGPYDYDVQHWVDKINRPDVRRFPLPSGRVCDGLTQFSRPARLGAHYRRELERARHVQVVLYANVVDIETDSDGAAVSRLEIRTLSARSFSASARRYVLACGGIENPRLLLASNKTHAAGLGNAHDLVGRYFADHPRVHVGRMHFAPQWRGNKLYDIKFHYLNDAVSHAGTYVSSQFSLAPRVQRDEGLLNALLWFSSQFPGDNSDAAEAVIRMKHRLEQKSPPEFKLHDDISLLARHPLDMTGFLLSRLVPSKRLTRQVKVTVICEPEPNRDSRVTLSPTERDALGLPRVRLDWRLGSGVARTIDRTLQIFADELHAGGIGRLDLPAPIEGGAWPHTRASSTDNFGTWHHMSTTKMNDSPRLGVVDRNARVHGLSNLYVAGSSIFPMCGANYPTITICALSLKLADHLAELSHQPDALAAGGRPATHAADPPQRVRGSGSAGPLGEPPRGTGIASDRGGPD